MQNSNVKYVVVLHERDEAYTAVIHRKKWKTGTVYIKGSWILEGQDREGAFISAVRRLYATVKFPEVEMIELLKGMGEYRIASEFKGTVRQLVGLADFGPRMWTRDEKTNEIITRRAAEQPEKKRLDTRQYYHNRIKKPTESTGPRHLCEVLRDAILGLLNIYRMGYVVREITPDNIAFDVASPVDKAGYMLSKDGKSIEGKHRAFKGFVYDFTICKAMNEETGRFSGDSEKMEITPTTPTPLLSAKKRADYVHLPTYDLKSFLWLLLYTATEIIGDYVSGKKKVRLDDPEYLVTKAKMKNSVPDAGSSDKGASENEKNDSGPSEQEQTAKATSERADSDEGQTREPMDVDPGNASGATNAEKSSDDDVEMNEVKAQLLPDSDNDEEKKRKRDDSADSEEHGKTTGKPKVTLEDCDDENEDGKTGGNPKVTLEDCDDENGGGSNKNDEKKNDDSEQAASNEEKDDDDSRPPTLPPNIWYYKRLGPWCIISILKPPEFKPPANFKPPEKGPEYVAFQEDRMAHVLHSLLEPDPLAAVLTAPPKRRHLIEKFEHFLFNSPGMKPFWPLAMQLFRMNLSLYVPKDELAKGREYTSEQIEEIFGAYLQAFEEHMPQEENWYYLQEYEGEDVQYKFDHDEFLGAFASPTNYKRPA